MDFDFIILGSGPAGQKAAIAAAKHGMSVAVVEKGLFPGGGCVNSGTIPSKSLRESILDLTGFYESHFSDCYTPLRKELKSEDLAKVRMDILNNRLKKIIREETEIIARRFKKNGIKLFQGSGCFLDPYRIKIESKSGKITELKGRFIIIATGSKPRNPMDVPFDKSHILDSTRLLQIDSVPKSLIVLGGGIVGTEYASFFSVLGTKVTLIDKQKRLMGWLDSEMSLYLVHCLKDNGLKFLSERTPHSIFRKGDLACVELDNGQVLEAEKVLYALGRGACTEGLSLDKTSIIPNEKGFIPVNEFYQTLHEHIYAVGDVIGPPALASTSMEQGRRAAIHAIEKPSSAELMGPSKQSYPLGIYTIPEISSVGVSEEQLIRDQKKYEVGRAYYYELTRSRISGASQGLFKILFDPETLEILGIHILGRSATELIHIGQMAISLKVKLNFFVENVFNYPTYAEGYRIAAFNGLNKVKWNRKNG